MGRQNIEKCRHFCYATRSARWEGQAAGNTPTGLDGPPRRQRETQLGVLSILPLVVSAFASSPSSTAIATPRIPPRILLPSTVCMTPFCLIRRSNFFQDAVTVRLFANASPGSLPSLPAPPPPMTSAISPSIIEVLFHIAAVLNSSQVSTDSAMAQLYVVLPVSFHDIVPTQYTAHRCPLWLRTRIRHGSFDSALRSYS